MLFLNRQQSNAVGPKLEQQEQQERQQQHREPSRAGGGTQQSFRRDDKVYSVRSKLLAGGALSPIVGVEAASAAQWPSVHSSTSETTSTTTQSTHHHHRRIRYSTMPFAVSAVSAFTTLVLLTVAGPTANASADLASSSSAGESSSSYSEAFSANSSANGWPDHPMSDEQRSVYNRLMDVEFGSSAMARRPRRSPIYQNEFAVYIPSGAATADAVASKYGFRNTGQVSEGWDVYFFFVAVCVQFH